MSRSVRPTFSAFPTRHTSTALPTEHRAGRCGTRLWFPRHRCGRRQGTAGRGRSKPGRSFSVFGERDEENGPGAHPPQARPGAVGVHDSVGITGANARTSYRLIPVPPGPPGHLVCSPNAAGGPTADSAPTPGRPPVRRLAARRGTLGRGSGVDVGATSRRRAWPPTSRARAAHHRAPSSSDDLHAAEPRPALAPRRTRDPGRTPPHEQPVTGAPTSQPEGGLPARGAPSLDGPSGPWIAYGTPHCRHAGC